MKKQGVDPDISYDQEKDKETYADTGRYKAAGWSKWADLFTICNVCEDNRANN